MSTDKQIHIVKPDDMRCISANVKFNTTFLTSNKQTTWKKQVIEKKEVAKNPLRFLFTVKDEGFLIEQSKKMMIMYTFKKSEIGKYIKFYAYIEKFGYFQQSTIFYVEDKCNTNVRIRDVEPVDLDSTGIAVGEKLKLRVTEYNVAEKKVSSYDKKDIKWMIKVGNESDERLIIDGLVITGHEIELQVPEEWKDKEILFMPYLNKHDKGISAKIKIEKDFYYKGTKNWGQLQTGFATLNTKISEAELATNLDERGRQNVAALKSISNWDKQGSIKVEMSKLIFLKLTVTFGDKIIPLLIPVPPLLAPAIHLFIGSGKTIPLEVNLGRSIVKAIYEYGAGTRQVLSDDDNIENKVIDNFYKLKYGKKLSFDENSIQSKKLHNYQPFLQYYNNYLEVIKIMLQEKTLEAKDGFDIANIFTRQLNLDTYIPNFSHIKDIPFYDYYGLMGWTQAIKLDLEIAKTNNNNYKVKSKMHIRDWYGADWGDVNGGNLSEILNLIDMEWKWDFSIMDEFFEKLKSNPTQIINLLAVIKECIRENIKQNINRIINQIKEIGKKLFKELEANKKGNIPSLIAFFWLQHYYGCHPFETEIVFEKTDTISL